VSAQGVAQGELGSKRFVPGDLVRLQRGAESKLFIALGWVLAGAVVDIGAAKILRLREYRLLMLPLGPGCIAEFTCEEVLRFERYVDLTRVA